MAGKLSDTVTKINTYADSVTAYAQGAAQFAGSVQSYTAGAAQAQGVSAQLSALLGSMTEGSEDDNSKTEQVANGLAQAMAAADSLETSTDDSVAGQVSAAAGAVSEAAGAGAQLQGDAGTIASGLASAESAIDILSSIDTSSMDEETAAAVNGAVQECDRSNFRWCGHSTEWC